MMRLILDLPTERGGERLLPGLRDSMFTGVGKRGILYFWRCADVARVFSSSIGHGNSKSLECSNHVSPTFAHPAELLHLKHGHFRCSFIIYDSGASYVCFLLYILSMRLDGKVSRK